MKIIKRNEDLRNGINVFRIDFQSTGAIQIKKWSESPDMQYNDFTDFMVAEQDQKYYVFAATSNSDFIGTEVTKEVALTSTSKSIKNLLERL